MCDNSGVDNIKHAANAAKAPPQTDPARTLEGPNTSTLNPELVAPLTGLPTLHGPPPRGCERFFGEAPPGHVPEFAPLPAPRQRCPYSGGSRSWLIEHGEAGHFALVRVRQVGKLRGKVLMHVPSLLAWLRGQMEGGAR